MKDLLDLALPVEKAFFGGCHEGVLRLQQCCSCKNYQFYPRQICQVCWHRDLEWVESSGSGTVLSFTIVRIPVLPEYESPYIAALVKLSEGPTMMTHIKGCEAEDVCVGAEVSVAFADIAGWKAMPVFNLKIK